MRKLIAAGIIGVLSLAPMVLSAPSASAQVTDSITCSTSGWDHSDSAADPFNTPVGAERYTADGLHLGPITEAGKQSGYVALVAPVKLSSVNQNDTGMNYVAITGPTPGYQLRVHPAGDNTWAGHLVYEGGGKWWATRPSSWPLVPSATMGLGGATLDEYVAAYPDTTISHVGFSLGSGVVGEGTLKSLTFQGKRWVFGECVIETTTTTTSPTDTGTTTTPPTSTTTTTSESSSTTTATTTGSTTATTTSTTSGETTTSTTEPAVVPVGNNTDDLAYTGTSGIGTYLGIAGLLIVLGLASFVGLRIQCKRQQA